MNDCLPEQPARDPGGSVYRLTIRSLPSGYPPIARLKRALKALLRTYDFRVVEAIQILPPGTAAGEKTGDNLSPVDDGEPAP